MHHVNTSRAPSKTQGSPLWERRTGAILVYSNFCGNHEELLNTAGREGELGAQSARVRVCPGFT